jgi:hypothetical protein
MPDKDGYPTENELKTIREWDFFGAKNQVDCYHQFMIYIQNIWHWGKPYFYCLSDNRWIAITGGWSGNEDIINAMENNKIFWVMYWYESRRGGKYKFMPYSEFIDW